MRRTPCEKTPWYGRFAWMALIAALALQSACSDANSADKDFNLPPGDAGVDAGAAADIGKSDSGPAGDSAGAVDAGGASDGGIVADTAAVDAGGGTVAPVDAGPANTAPTFQAIGALELDQGASTTLDVSGLLGDAEDGAAGLVLSWSAKHVALHDPGTHVLYVVAPTTWSGVEEIALTATDSGGLTAVSTLKVTVHEVVVAKPVPVSDCGKVVFTYPAGTGQHEVLLSGTFNGWASTPDKADKLEDPGGTGVWSVEKTLVAGVYQYKFKVDNEWKTDPKNANKTPDGYGGHNSVIEVAPCDP